MSAKEEIQRSTNSMGQEKKAFAISIENNGST